MPCPADIGESLSLPDAGRPDSRSGGRLRHLCRDLNQDGIERIFQACAIASQSATRHCICCSSRQAASSAKGLRSTTILAPPVELHLYNAGTVASIAVLAYLGAGPLGQRLSNF